MSVLNLQIDIKLLQFVLDAFADNIIVKQLNSKNVLCMLIVVNL